MNDAFQLLATSPSQLALACLVAFGASILGGLSGFGTGLVLPVFLVPLVGVTNVIPVMAVAMLLGNGSRFVAFWREVEWTHVRRMLAGVHAWFMELVVIVGAVVLLWRVKW